MLNFRDGAAAIDDPKTARMEQRTKPHVKQQIQRAAALLGVDETTFVTSVAHPCSVNPCLPSGAAIEWKFGSISPIFARN